MIETTDPLVKPCAPQKWKPALDINYRLTRNFLIPLEDSKGFEYNHDLWILIAEAVMVKPNEPIENYQWSRFESKPRTLKEFEKEALVDTLITRLSSYLYDNSDKMKLISKTPLRLKESDIF